MALTKCKECSKEISNSARICPHCGVRDPGLSAKQKYIGCLIVIVIAAVIAYFMCSGEEKKVEAAKVCSATDLQCNYDKNMYDAITKCKPLVEHAAKNEFEWNDGIFDLIFSHARINSQKNQLTYIGDKVKFTNIFNAKIYMTYSCTLDLKTKDVVDFNIHEGKLQ